jgi:hypothetical protein
VWPLRVRKFTSHHCGSVFSSLMTSLHSTIFGSSRTMDSWQDAQWLIETESAPLVLRAFVDRRKLCRPRWETTVSSKRVFDRNQVFSLGGIRIVPQAPRLTAPRSRRSHRIHRALRRCCVPRHRCVRYQPRSRDRDAAFVLGGSVPLHEIVLRSVPENRVADRSIRGRRIIRAPERTAPPLHS